MPGFILASASPRRLSLLTRLGFDPARVCPAQIDETPKENEKPSDYARRMACEKANAILARNPGQCASAGYVLAADTVVALGRRILPKAETRAQARDCLEKLSGRAHRVYGGVCLANATGRQSVRVVQTTVKFRLLNEGDINFYLDSGDWDGKAGGYAIQGLAEMFVRQIVGSYSNVVGLPVFETANLLAGNGIFPAGHSGGEG